MGQASKDSPYYKISLLLTTGAFIGLSLYLIIAVVGSVAVDIFADPAQEKRPQSFRARSLCARELEGYHQELNNRLAFEAGRLPQDPLSDLWSPWYVLWQKRFARSSKGCSSNSDALARVFRELDELGQNYSRVITDLHTIRNQQDHRVRRDITSLIPNK